MIVYDIPMKVPFRGLRRRRGILFEGPAGWAEWSPFPEYDDHEALPWLRAARDAAQHGYPGPFRDSVEVNGIVPALPPEEAARRAIETQCRSIKIKVAGETSLEEDVARVRAVRDALPEAKIRLDANGGWNLEEAQKAIELFKAFDLEYIEQPCRDVEDLARLRGMGVMIVADESIRKAEDPYKVAELDAADAIVLKVQPLGGVRACLQLAKEIGLPVVVSSAVETSVGLAAAVALAAALPELHFACGLETIRLLDGDVTSNSLIPVEGRLVPPIIGVQPDRASEFLADEATTKWWLERYERVSNLESL